MYRIESIASEVDIGEKKLWCRRKMCHFTNVTIFILMFTLSIIHTHATSNATTNTEKRLSRKRRYLIFPDSSSFQLVYDSTITIPDYTLYVTTGVTCALAWGLPTTPPTGNEFSDKDDEVLPGTNDRHDKNQTDTTATNAIPSNAYNTSSVENMLWKYFNYLQRRRPDSYYFDNTAHCVDGRCSNDKDTNTYGYSYGGPTGSSSIANQYKVPYASNYDRYRKYDAFTKYMVQKYFKPWMQHNANDKSSNQYNSGSQKASPHISTEWTTTTAKPKKPKDFEPVINKLHTVFPAMGKRSIRDRPLSSRQKFHIDHHRKTRHELYDIVENYLFAHGYNGTACVLKTLCEVGQKRNENEPGSFLAEIVRAIFSLPEAQLQQQHDRARRHIEYDVAHQMIDDCMARYSDCPTSVWDAGFLIDLSDENTKNRLLRDNVLAATFNKF